MAFFILLVIGVCIFGWLCEVLDPPIPKVPPADLQKIAEDINRDAGYRYDDEIL